MDNGDYFQYYPKLIANADDIFKIMLPMLKEISKGHKSYISQGKLFKARRISCIFAPGASAATSYGDLPLYPLELAPAMVTKLWDFIESEFKTKIGFVLCHVYRNGEDYISWHSDKEQGEGDIYSLSLGETRTFRFREIGTTKGFSHEFKLESGDLVHMKSPCQRKYQHCVVKIGGKKGENTGPRINFTFRN